MTFYQAVKELKAKGFTMIRKYSSCEIWEKGDKLISIPDLPNIPQYTASKIKTAE